MKARDERLVAFVVAESAVPPEPATLARFLRRQLPGYMVPAFFVAMEALPLTGNGKVDRSALNRLRPPGSDAAVSTPNTARLRTPVEEALAGIWTDLLGIEGVNHTDDFFESGGHSLLATQLVSRLRQVFQVEVPLGQVFEHSELAAMATGLEEAMRAGDAVTLPPIEQAPWSNQVPLSIAQQRFWFLYRLAPQSPAFNIASAMRLAGAFDAAVLQQALTEIVGRHETLRTTFVEIDEEPWQIIDTQRPFRLPQVDMEALPKTIRKKELLRLAYEESHCPFDLSLSWPLRVVLLRLSKDEHIALLTLHHIVADGWSMGIFYNEIVVFYQALSAGRRPALPELPVRYADYVSWQRQYLQGKVLENQLKYWRRQLGGTLPRLELPNSRPRPVVPRFRGRAESFALSTELCAALKKLRQQEGVTTFMVLLAALKALLYHYTGQHDIIVGTNVANRTQAEIEGLIGFFVNNLALRTDFSGEPTFRGLLSQVRDVALGAYTHQEIPFEWLIKDLQPIRPDGYSPIYQVMFVLQNNATSHALPGGLTVTPFKVEHNKANFDLMLIMSESGDSLTGSFTYDVDLFDASAISQMVEDYEKMLQKVIVEPDRKLSNFSILDEPENQELINAFNEEF